MTGRDRLRELLDAVLDEQHTSLEEMASGAFSSPFHFARQLSAGAGEPPVAMRRRVMLERAAWQLGRGTSVTDAAFAAGYESVEGFARAFARAYFHPPMSLWVHTGEHTMTQPLDLLVHHDLDDTRDLIDLAKQLSDDDYRRAVTARVHSWEGEEASVAAVLTSLVVTKEVWLAAVLGEDFPADRPDDVAALRRRHDDVSPRWLEILRDIERRDAWDDRIVDALCEPPESFVLGSIVAHVITYDAHRRLGVRAMLRELGVDADEGDPINWLRRRTEATA